MPKFISIGLALVLLLCLGVAAVAGEDGEGELDFKYQEEVTVAPDEVNAPGVTSVVQAAYTWQPSSSPTDDVEESR